MWYSLCSTIDGSALRKETYGGSIMAVYEYACMECDITQEKERSIHDSEPEYFCESCGYALTRVFSPFGLSFKGGGFYSTDGRNV